MYQIDNHYARFLLVRATKQKENIDDAMNDFEEAHRIIYAQSGKERQYFPYRVAELYNSFYDIYSTDMQKKHKDSVVNAANEMITRIYRLPKERQAERHVQRCESSLRRLLERASGIDYRRRY